MILKIRNFGPIEHCEIDLSKDFTLIVGQNNIGKSYAISLIYVLLKVLSRRPEPRYYSHGGANYYYREIRESRKIETWLESTTKRVEALEEPEDIDITQEVTAHFAEYLGMILLPELQEAFEGTFNDLFNLQNRLVKGDLEFSIHNDTCAVAFGIVDGKLTVKWADFGAHQFLLRVVKSYRNNKSTQKQTLIYAQIGNNVDRFKLNARLLFSGLVDGFYLAVSSIAGGLHYLPASRSGLYQALSAFGQIVAELSKSRNYLTRKIELPAISETVSDYFLKLSDIRVNPQAKLNKAFLDVAEIIENDILKGKVEFEAKTKRLIYKPEKIDLSLDLSATSSMVSEISPIVTYLKFVLPYTELSLSRVARWRVEQTSRQVLIIEEPEAHLHPEVQIRLMAAFSQLVMGTRTRIIMTSHSNYIFNKVNNLVIAGAIPHSNLQALLFQPTPHGSVATTLPVGKYGVDDENFADVTESLYEERVSLLKGVKV